MLEFNVISGIKWGQAYPEEKTFEKDKINIISGRFINEFGGKDYHAHECLYKLEEYILKHSDVDVWFWPETRELQVTKGMSKHFLDECIAKNIRFKLIDHDKNFLFVKNNISYNILQNDSRGALNSNIISYQADKTIMFTDWPATIELDSKNYKRSLSINRTPVTPINYDYNYGVAKFDYATKSFIGLIREHTPDIVVSRSNWKLTQRADEAIKKSVRYSKKTLQTVFYNETGINYSTKRFNIKYVYGNTEESFKQLSNFSI